MQYEFPLIIPANTTKSNFITTILKMNHGIISKGEVEFPRGCVGLAGVRFLRGMHQVFPIETGNWFVSDNNVIKFDSNYSLGQQPFELYMQGYNEDDTFMHTITARFTLVKNKISTLDYLENLPVLHQEKQTDIAGYLKTNKKKDMI